MTVLTAAPTYVTPPLPNFPLGSGLMSRRAGPTARRVPLLLAFLLAGCSAGGFLRPCPDCAAGSAPPEGEAKAEKPPPPHTLPQALCAYWKALCSHPCSSGEDEKNGEKKNGEGANG